MQDTPRTASRPTIVAEIVSAYVRNNHVSVAHLPGLIADVDRAIGSLSASGAARAVVPEVDPVPAVPVKKSVSADWIICLEDGKSFKSLKRHLASTYGMTPDEYRRKWKLPHDYPMVASGYSARRKEIALSLGLGRKRSKEDAPAAREQAATAEPEIPIVVEAGNEADGKSPSRRGSKPAGTAVRAA